MTMENSLGALNSLGSSHEHKVGDVVWVYINDKEHQIQPFRGVIRFIGREGRDIFAGIEMDMPCGQGNGEYNGKRLFKCAENHAHFTSLAHVKTYVVQSSGGREPTAEHQVKDVVWVFINETPCRGVIEIIDKEYGGYGTLAGIRLDMPFGEGNGQYNGKQLFECAENHAHFTPIVNVISKKTFREWNRRPLRAGQIPECKDQATSTPLSSCFPTPQMARQFSVQCEEDVNLQEKFLERDKTKALTKSQKNDKDLVHQSQFDKHVIQDDTNSGILNDQRSFSGQFLDGELKVGSMVEVKFPLPKYGVIKWIGDLPDVDSKVAGLELEEEMEAGSDGTYAGQRFFTCAPRRALFIKLRNCCPAGSD